MSTIRLNDQRDSSLRSRILGGSSDVPIFENYFRRKAATAALCADPGSGQTPGFAHRADSFLREDPSLLRLELDSSSLQSHLANLGNNAVVLGQNPIQILSTSIDLAGVKLAPIEWRPEPWIEPSLGEKISVFWTAFTNNIVLHLRVLIGAVSSLNAPSYIFRIFVQIFAKALGVAVNTTASIANFLSLFDDLSTITSRKLVAGISATYRGFGRAVRGLGTRIAALKKTRIKLTIPSIRFPARPKFSLPKLSLPKFSIPQISKSGILSLTGQGMIVGSIVILLMTIGPVIRLQAGEWWTKSRTAITGKAIEPQVKPVLTDTIRKPEDIPPEEKQFQLLIPKLDANMKVMANIDAGNEKEYTSALKKGVAHAAGSGLPGETNTTNKSIYIFGHSTNTIWNIERYNALFYSLKDLVPKDEIIVWFWGKEFKYQVKEVVKVDPKDLTYLTPQTDKDQLILQTCWPPGTTWKRLLVVAEPVGI